MSLINELVKDKIRSELREIASVLLEENVSYTREELTEILFAKKNIGYALFCKDVQEQYRNKNIKDLTRKCASLWKELSNVEKVIYTRNARNIKS